MPWRRPDWAPDRGAFALDAEALPQLLERLARSQLQIS